MLENEKAHTGTATTAGANVGDRSHFIIDAAISQARVSDLLRHGAGNPISCRELEGLTGWKPREITRAIERERRSGTPIVANGRGYFMPANDAELDSYLRSLQHRETEIRRTRNAIAATRQQTMDFGGVD